MSARTLGGVASLIFLFGLASRTQAVGPIVSLSLAPSTSTVAAGTTQPFTVQGKDADGAATDLTTNSVFATTDPRGFMTANVYTAGTTGSWTLTATYGALTADATVAVTAGRLTDLVLNPNSQPEYLTNGQSRTFTVEAFDAFNNPITGFSSQWSVEGKIGTITQINATSAKFTATDAGKGRVAARSSGETVFVDVSVAKGEPPVNTNVNSNANTNAAAANTNAANLNVNSQTNDNTNSQAVTANQNTNATTTPTACTAWPRTAWVWLYLAYLILLVGSLAALRSRRPAWWWWLPLILTVVALWLYFQYRCGTPVYPGLPYLILLTAIIGASWFTWQRGNTQRLQ